MTAENRLVQSTDLNRSDSAQSAGCSSTRMTVSVEWLAYFGLLLGALFLRLAALGQVPMSDYEAEQSLHAWHTIFDQAPGSYQVAESPLTYATQLATFSTLGASAFSARVGAALAGAALAMCPLLFRATLGITRTFVWSVLLSLLTLPVAASRLADGTTYLMLFALLSAWMIRRFWYSHEHADAMWASAFVTMMLLSGPTSIPLFAIMLAAGWLALWRTAISAPQRLELPGDDILQLSLKRLKIFPFARVALLSLAMASLVSTTLMLNPGGLKTVGALVNGAINVLAQGETSDSIRAGFVALFTYEPLLIVFAIGGAWLIWRHGAVSFIDRFAAAWAGIAAVALILAPGTRPADATWVVLPLSLLASYGITQLMVNRRVAALWAADESESEISGHEIYTTRFWWVKWLISACVLFLLLVASTHFLQVGRALLDVPAGATPADVLERLSVASYPRLAQGISFMLMTGIAAVVFFLLGTNVWGIGTCLQGVGLGFLWLLLLSGVGGAWNTAVVDVRNPASLWDGPAIGRDAQLMRRTLFELADRESEGFPDLALTIVIDPERDIHDDGLIAWLVRDFPQAQFVDDPVFAAGEPIVITTDAMGDPPDLAGDYVGQRFVLRRNSSFNEINVWQLPSWWSQHRLRDTQFVEDAVILWLRQDIYAGNSVASGP